MRGFAWIDSSLAPLVDCAKLCVLAEVVPKVEINSGKVKSCIERVSNVHQTCICHGIRVTRVGFMTGFPVVLDRLPSMAS